MLFCRIVTLYTKYATQLCVLIIISMLIDKRNSSKTHLMHAWLGRPSTEPKKQLDMEWLVGSRRLKCLTSTDLFSLAIYLHVFLLKHYDKLKNIKKIWIRVHSFEVHNYKERNWKIMKKKHPLIFLSLQICISR